MRHGFIGYGNVIRAIHKAMKNSEHNTFGYYSKTNSHKELRAFSSISELTINSDVIWLGIKPQNIINVLDNLKSEDLKDKLIISVVAGKSMGFIAESIGSDISIIRIMTNLAIEFGSSVTAYTNNNVDHPCRGNVKQLLENMGVLIETPERDFDMFTAIFGSGPAFLLKLIDVQKTKMMEMGVIEQDVNRMLVGLLAGTTDYYREYCNTTSIDKLIDNIASKGGTTEAGIKYLTDNNIDILFDNVINIAQKRAAEI